MFGGDACLASEDDELDRRLHPLLRREDTSEKQKRSLLTRAGRDSNQKHPNYFYFSDLYITALVTMCWSNSFSHICRMNGKLLMKNE